MAQNIDVCPTCGQAIKTRKNRFKIAIISTIIGIISGIIFGYCFSIWWFGPGMHFTSMSVIHYLAWAVLFGFIGTVIGFLIKR